MRRFGATLAAGSIIVATGCGSSGTPEPTNPAEVRSDAPSAPPPTPLAGVKKRLQGTWEIARYQSERPIPKEAMPIMGEMFDSLRMRFEGASVVVRAGKSTEEPAAFDVADEQGDSFKMVAKGGMFDGASCRFVADDRWEVADHGTMWPGTSVIKRLK